MRKIIISLLIIFFVGLFVFKGKNYSSVIQSFVSVEAKDIIDKINQQENFMVYIGRESCNHCVEFAPKLVDPLIKSDKKLFYVDLDQNNNLSPNFVNITNLNYVPVIIKFHNGKETQRLDSQASLEDIEEFFNSDYQ